MTAASANDIASAILRDGKVRVPHGDPAKAFLAYRSAASWTFYLVAYPMAALVVLILAISQFNTARGKWTTSKAEAEERGARVSKPIARRDS